MTSTAEHRTASVRIGRRSAGGFALAAAVVDAVGVVALVLFFAFEAGRSGQEVFGPLSDATGALFNLLLLPVLWFTAQRVQPRTPARTYALVTLVATGVGALNSALLVAGLLDDTISLELSLVVIAVQAGWFVLMGRRGRAALDLSGGLAGGALLIGVGMLAAIVLLVAGYLLPSTSAATVALWIAGGAVGGIAWASWPVWFAAVGYRLLRLGSSAVGE